MSEDFEFKNDYASSRSAVNVVFRYRVDRFAELQSLMGYYRTLNGCEREDDIEVLFTGPALNCLRYMWAERMKYDDEVLVIYKIDETPHADFLDNFALMDGAQNVACVEAAGYAADLISELHGVEVETQDIGRLIRATVNA